VKKNLGNLLVAKTSRANIEKNDVIPRLVTAKLTLDIALQVVFLLLTFLAESIKDIGSSSDSGDTNFHVPQAR